MVWPCKKDEQDKHTEKGIRIKVRRKKLMGLPRTRRFSPVVEDIKKMRKTYSDSEKGR